MQNILLLFARFGTHIVFIFFQVICFFLIINYNKGHENTFIHSSNYYSGLIDNKVSDWLSYLTLQEVNDSLANHNASLMELFINTKEDVYLIDQDSMQFDLIPGRIIKNTFHLRNNHITIDIGRNDGVQKDMGVVSEEGILGIVRNVSDHFSHVLSMLNSQTRISCTVKPHAYPGNLVWNNNDPKFMTLESIPKHVNLSVGDTVMTNGYSTIFPSELIVGTVTSFEVDRGSSDYKIKVKLINDVQNAKVAYVIKNRLAAEQQELEKEINE